MTVAPRLRRGDLPPLLARRVETIVILDGVFHQELAVSPREVRDALEAGVTVFGASSMGALRAAELQPLGMIGVGTIFGWYRDGTLTADDEVALLFDAETGRALTVPRVNVRHGLSAGVEEGLLRADEAALLLASALRTPYWELSWEGLLAALPGAVDGTRSRAGLARQLASHDLKRADADLCLREVAAYLTRRPVAAGDGGQRRPVSGPGAAERV